MEIHTLLRNEVDAFDFLPDDFALLRARLPQANLMHHDEPASMLRQIHSANYVLTWPFESAWYENADALRAVLTPAAGTDWVAQDPRGHADVVHGTFHGTLIRESLLHAMLFMNHRMPAMMRNFQMHGWDRNLQAGSRLLAGQRVLIIGYGNIGKACGDWLERVGLEVVGIGRTAEGRKRGLDSLAQQLPQADHVVIILPGDASTDALIDEQALALCKPGAFVYNFGRGNALPSDALLKQLDRLGGAFLDVVDQEPLPADSPLWHAPNVMITPHSSCVYREYKPHFLTEVATYIQSREQAQ